MIKTCRYVDCSNLIAPPNSYCSLSCANTQRFINNPVPPRKKPCVHCNESFIYKDKRQRFCSHRCAAIYNNKKRGRKVSYCKNCIKETANYKSTFCSQSCICDHKEKKWLAGSISGTTKYGMASYVRNHIVERDKVCVHCHKDYINPYSGLSVLQIDHIDGNWQNNRPENLRLLCPTCHSLTEFFGALNKKGRTWKAKYNQFESSS